MGVANKVVRTEASPEAPQCLAVNDTVMLLHDKWTVLVLGALSHAPSLRYNALQRAVTGISQRMLTLTLKTLEQHGLVKRTIFATVPPRVDYELTPLGRTLEKPLTGLLDWSAEHHEDMENARRAYARRIAGTDP